MAKRVAALGGWPHIDVYEQTAHRLGEHRAIAGISIENPEWSAIEEYMIEKALRERPNAVIGLADGYLPGPRILDLLQRFADIVTIRCGWLELQQRLIDEIDAAPERLPEFMENEIPDLHTLQILQGQRSQLYASAAFTLDASGLAPGIVAHRVTSAINSPA